MERTQPRIILCSGLLKLDVVTDDADDVCLLLDGVCEVAGVGHGVWLLSGIEALM